MQKSHFQNVSTDICVSGVSQVSVKCIPKCTVHALVALLHNSGAKYKISIHEKNAA